MEVKNNGLTKRSPSKSSSPRPASSHTPSPRSFILPHSSEAGDPYYIGDVYSRVNRGDYVPAVLQDRQIDPDRPYYSYLRRISKEWPYMQYLADFMETTCAPPKRNLLTDQDRVARASRFKVCLLEIQAEKAHVKTTNFEVPSELELAFQKTPKSNKSAGNRLFVVEDLSRDMIETLGSGLEIDPSFFRGHISDYLWYNIRDPWFEVPQLNLTTSQREFFNVRYVQPRYFRSSASAQRAKLEAGGFNVLRRIDLEASGSLALDEPGSTVGLIRTKLSFWVNARAEGQSLDSVLLVDPPITEGYRLWNACNNFESFRGIRQRISNDHVSPKMSMFDEFVYWTESLAGEINTANVDQDPRLLIKFALMQICSYWRTTLEYATTRMTQVEWEVEDASKRHPDGRGLDGCLERLHRWRRVLPTYDAMVNETINGILRPDHRLFSNSNVTTELRKDFQQVHEQIIALQRRAERIVSLVGTLIHIDESKKAVQENESVFRLTCLLGVFVPMSFLSSLFSMNGDLGNIKTTLWVFFAVSVPLTILCLSAIAVVGPGSQNVPLPRFLRRKQQ